MEYIYLYLIVDMLLLLQLINIFLHFFTRNFISLMLSFLLKKKLNIRYNVVFKSTEHGDIMYDSRIPF